MNFYTINFNENNVNAFFILYIFLRRMDAAHHIFKKFRVFISQNVPAVYDVFAAAIRERGAFQQPQKCGWRLAWEWSAAE
jgi:hypothetical protein